MSIYAPDGIWQNYTPSLTNVTIGNGTLTAAYSQFANTALFTVRFVLGSTSSISGAITFSLPVTANSSYTADDLIGWCRITDSGVTLYPSICMFVSTTTAKIRPVNATGTYDTANADTSSTVPFTFGTADSWYVSGMYQTA